MFTVSKEFNFCAAHRVLGAGESENLHGHNYRVKLMLGRSELQNGVVRDFKAFTLVEEWIKQHWDHCTILKASDDALGRMLTDNNWANVTYMLDTPTAENMCAVLHRVASKFYPESEVIIVTVFETPTCIAQFDGNYKENSIL